MFTTEDVSQAPMALLNRAAPCNMFAMVVTLDVSKLTGWLNAVFCRVARGGRGEGRAACRAGGRLAGRGRRGEWRRRKQRAGREPAAEGRWPGGARVERTKNMPLMVVTLDVSKLSGWLNADAICRVERETIGGGVTCGQAGGRVGRLVAQGAGRPGLWRLRAGHARSAPET